MHTRGAKKDTDDLKKSADALKDSLKTMSRDTMTSLIMAEEAVIRGIEALGNSKVKKTKYDPGINRNIEYEENRGLTSAEQEKLDAAKQNLNLLRAELNSLGLIENQRRKVNELEKAWVNARTTSEKDAAKIVYDNAQKELEQIEGKKEKEKELVDNEYELRKVKYELGLISLEEYRSFLKERIASVKQSTKEELELYKSYKEDLKNLDESTKVKGLDIVFENAKQEKAFNLIKDNYERRGIVWDENAKAFALRMAMDIKDDPIIVPSQMKPHTGIDRGTMDEPIKLTKDEAEKLNFTINSVSQVFSELGNSIADAMFGAKKSIGEVIAEMTKLIAKIFIMKGLELLASSVMNAIFPGSGTAARAGFAVASGSSGGLKKSVMDKDLYSYKFDNSSAAVLQPTFVFENTIDTQEIVYKGIRKIQDLYR
jgi:preprotein translocase subunit SecD